MDPLTPPVAPRDVRDVVLGPPPPVRRIVADGEPTVVQPPPLNGHGPRAGGAGAIGLAAPLRRAEPSTGPKIERMRAEGVTIAYGEKLAVGDVTLPVRQGEVLALIGPSGCGKTTLLRSLNRLVEITPTAVRGGRITLDGEDIDRMEVTALRRRVSMVFQQPNPFPMSVFDNVAYALREQGSRRPGKDALYNYVGDALVRAGLWDEVGAALDHPALRLSGGQQQRLCIARALAARPEVLLLDEPCSALDPRSTQVIEELILRLREEVAVVIVTHNMQQALRIADHVGFMYLGELVEYGPAEQVFGAPCEPRTREYVGGAFG
jgi:phosphate transport system ATP-binding protein